ncbi:MAG: YciI family protein [Pseudomonadota bacterium]
MAEFAPTVPRIEGNVYLVLAYDGEGSAAERDASLDEHLAYVEKRCDDYLVCGPLSEPGGSELIGSFFLLTAESEQAARELVSGDPYVRSGMYAEIRVMSATAAGGRFMGGVIWESADAIRAAQAGAQ